MSDSGGFMDAVIAAPHVVEVPCVDLRFDLAGFFDHDCVISEGA